MLFGWNILEPCFCDSYKRQVFSIKGLLSLATKEGCCLVTRHQRPWGLPSRIQSFRPPQRHVHLHVIFVNYPSFFHWGLEPKIQSSGQLSDTKSVWLHLQQNVPTCSIQLFYLGLFKVIFSFPTIQTYINPHKKWDDFCFIFSRCQQKHNFSSCRKSIKKWTPRSFGSAQDPSLSLASSGLKDGDTISAVAQTPRRVFTKPARNSQWMPVVYMENHHFARWFCFCTFLFHHLSDHSKIGQIPPVKSSCSELRSDWRPLPVPLPCGTMEVAVWPGEIPRRVVKAAMCRANFGKFNKFRWDLWDHGSYVACGAPK